GTRGREREQRERPRDQEGRVRGRLRELHAANAGALPEAHQALQREHVLPQQVADDEEVHEGQDLGEGLQPRLAAWCLDADRGQVVLPVPARPHPPQDPGHEDEAREGEEDRDGRGDGPRQPNGARDVVARRSRGPGDPDQRRQSEDEARGQQGPGHRAIVRRPSVRVKALIPLQCRAMANEANEERIAAFKEVAEEMPDDPEVRFGLAGLYLDAGQTENAVTEYQETIRLKADYSAAYRGLGRALERAGRIPEAIAAYRQGRDVATRNGDLQTVKEI